MSIEERIIKVDAEAIQKEFSKNDLKPARSKAELVRTRNSNILLFIAVSQLFVNGAVALKVFGIID